MKRRGEGSQCLWNEDISKQNIPGTSPSPDSFTGGRYN
jgi:hypothetical protein